MVDASKYRTLIRRKSNKITVHNMNCEIKYFLENVWKDKRVVVDKNLEDILIFESKKLKFIEKNIPFWNPYYYGKAVDKTILNKVKNLIC